MAGQELRGEAWVGKQEKIVEMGGKPIRRRMNPKTPGKAPVQVCDSFFVSTPTSKNMSYMFTGDRAKEPRGQWVHNNPEHGHSRQDADRSQLLNCSWVYSPEKIISFNDLDFNMSMRRVAMLDPSLTGRLPFRLMKRYAQLLGRLVL